MQVILLEKLANLGQLGDVVKVKDGFARNFLIPQGKARRATEAALKGKKPDDAAIAQAAKLAADAAQPSDDLRGPASELGEQVDRLETLYFDSAEPTEA